MEEIEYKLNSRNVVLVTRTISSLIETIKQKYDEEKQKNSKHELKELKFLKEKCTSLNPLISLTAGKALFSLVKDGTLQTSTTISDLISLLMNAGCYSGIISTMYELLILEMDGKLSELEKVKKPYEPHYNLVVPQHPLISVVLHNSQTWIDIFELLKNVHASVDDKKSYYINKLVMPYYFYVFCDYNSKVPPLCRYKLWEYLVLNFLENDFELYVEILSWMRFEDRNRLFEISSMTVEIIDAHLAAETNTERLEIFSLYLCAVMYEMVKKNLDIRSTLRSLSSIFELVPDLNCLNCALLIIADCIPICPVVYLEDLLNICDRLLLLNRANNLIIKTITAACLHWVLHSSLMTSHCAELLTRIIKYEENFNSQNCASTVKIKSLFSTLLIASTNEHIHLAQHLCIITETTSEKELLTWLKTLSNTPESLTKRIENFLLGLLIFNFSNRDITLEVLNVLTICADSYPEITTNFLTIILYKLSNTSDSKLHFHLLKVLPKMGTLKENLPVIVSTLQIFVSNPNHQKLKIFAMSLFYDLWTLQVRCYPLLQNLLVQNQTKDELEFYATKANILMKLCEKKPELYGTELAAHLSKVLNKCKTEEHALAASFALQGLKHLCKEGIVDIATAWATLAPSFIKEDRTIVLISLCDLLTEVAVLPDQYDCLIYEITGRLWKYATYYHKAEVNSAAYKALGAFTLEQISANIMNVIEDEGLVPDNFGHVPGSAWLKLLQSVNYASLDAVGDLLINFVSKEISGYVKGTYHIGEGKREPANFNSLYSHSIVRALGNYVKENASKYDNVPKEVYLQCLRILSQEYCKPLPPLDWCFLQELIHTPETRGYCISIASHQVVLSGTARRFMENFIESIANITPNEEDISCIYKNLKFLTNSIQPILMKPFLENTFLFLKMKENNELLGVMLENIKEVFRSRDIQDVNKALISKVLVDEIKMLLPGQTYFNKFLECIIELPEKFLIQIIGLTSSNEMSTSEIELAIKVRAAIVLAQREPSFDVIDQAIFVVSSIPSEYQYLFVELNTICEKHKEEQCSVDWMMDFLGQIQVNLADNKYGNIQEVLFLCDVYMMAVIIFSGHNILDDVMHQNARYTLFPQALAWLLKHKHWNNYVSQILEWLNYMMNFGSLPFTYRRIFQHALISLRHEEIFCESFRWMKYIGAKVKKDIYL